MKISIIYFSASGKTFEMAQVVAEGAHSAVPGVDVRLFELGAVEKEFLTQSAAVVFGTPTYASGPCWQLKKWFDEYREVNLGGKLGSAFATANYIQGGADAALLSVITAMTVRGMLVYSSGASLGQPFIHLGAVAVKDHFEEAKPLFKTFGERIAQKAAELFGSKDGGN